MGEPRKPKMPVNNFAFFEDEFRKRLQALLEEMFSEEEPLRRQKILKNVRIAILRLSANDKPKIEYNIK